MIYLTLYTIANRTLLPSTYRKHDRTPFPNIITPRSHPICSTQSTRDRTLFPNIITRDRIPSVQPNSHAIALHSQILSPRESHPICST
ncbi:MAG: hypothetical protein RIE73_02135 [Coleofasciculus sp. C1-SOL-03]|uniref:hypothetical protein n=1 Tax=Coleofasciculus sp. C1-SOL-03 TaxID=3069522 RepID=UPI0032F3F59C